MTLPVEAIIAPSWATALTRRSGSDGIIEYAILSKKGQYSSRNYGVSVAEANGIRAAFAEIDAVTGANFAESSQANAQIILYSVRAYKARGTVGLTWDTGQQFVTTWRDYGGSRLTLYELSTIKHEIGHAVGLDHPYGDGYYEGVTTLDTIMSYNEVDHWVTNYSATDTQALQSLWGAPIN